MFYCKIHFYLELMKKKSLILIKIVIKNQQCIFYTYWIFYSEKIRLYFIKHSFHLLYDIIIFVHRDKFLLSIEVRENFCFGGEFTPKNCQRSGKFHIKIFTHFRFLGIPHLNFVFFGVPLYHP